jgi:hypothetical protein
MSAIDSLIQGYNQLKTTMAPNKIESKPSSILPTSNPQLAATTPVTSPVK